MPDLMRDIFGLKKKEETRMGPGRLVVCAAVGLMLCANAHANLLTNGSFELPVVPVGTFNSFNTGSAAITGWTVVGPAGTQVSPVSTSFSQGGVAFVAQDGAQWLDLTGNGSNSTEGVVQSVATTVGHLYELSYFVGNTTGGGIFGSSSTVHVLLNGILTFSDTNADVSPTTQDWNQFTRNFVATSSTTAITFLNADPVGDNDNGLDNVVLLDLGVAPVATAPEPVTLALLGFGLASLGFMRRNRAA